MRDPDGANLDRVQVIKGWVDAAGKTHEKVHVRQPPPTRSVRLEVFWSDPTFHPAERAFYYVRVLEIPTPGWTTHDLRAFGVRLPTDVPTSIHERAYTTPIWYGPK